MKAYRWLLPLTLFLSAACVALPAAVPTSSPAAAPTSTSAPNPSSTPAATPTQPPATDASGFESLVAAKGFSITVPLPLVSNSDGQIVSIADDSRSLIYSFIGDDQYDNKTSMPEVITQYLGSLQKKGLDLKMGSTADVQIDGNSGTSAEVSGTVAGQAVAGRAIAVTPRAGFVLFGLGIARLAADPQKWASAGSPAFDKLIGSIRFIDSSNKSCTVSTDKTYGYQPDHPIQVGGGDFGGPSRERAYLDNLRAANGENVTYSRNGSTDANGVILDLYSVSGPGLQASLYIDEYNFSEPLAPVGFTCAGPFPLEQP